MKKKVAIIFGGKSAEHEVSIRSARNVTEALDKNLFEAVLIGISKEGSWFRFNDPSAFANLVSLTLKNIPNTAEPVTLVCHQGKPSLFSLQAHTHSDLDIAFPILHGTMGEDGTIQGLFKMVQLPFVGCGVFSSAAGMDKEVMKRLLKEAHIPSAKYVLLTPEAKHSYDYLVQELGSPFFIKPANAGSSVGVHKIKAEDEFKKKLADAFQFDRKVLAEEFMQGREIECSVMGPNHHPEASLPGEIIPQHDFYSYEAKYVDDNGALLKIPAEMDSESIERLQSLAKKTYHVMGCDGITRVDFFMKKDGQLVINEINTMPGFTKISMYPKMWEATGIDYKSLITKLIGWGFERHQLEQSLRTSYFE